MRKGVAQRRQRRLLRRLRDFAQLVIAAILAYAIYWLWGSPVWDWQGQLRITGNRVVSQAEILQRLQRPSPTPLYRLNPSWIEDQLTAVPAIAEVAVRRWLFPARLEITVIERHALVGLEGGSPSGGDTNGGSPSDGNSNGGSPSENHSNGGSPSGGDAKAASPSAGANGGHSLWMDQQGVVFSTPPKLMKPQFAVKLQTKLRPGERLDPAMSAPLFELLATWPKGQGGTIDLRKPHDVRFYADGWPVRLGEIQGVGLKLGMLDHLKPLAQKYKGQLEYIDLRYPASPTFKLHDGKKIDVAKSKASPAPASPSPATGGASPAVAAPKPAGGNQDEGPTPSTPTPVRTATPAP